MKCPICKRTVDEPPPDKPRGSFPFCSERCKLIDLGRWLGERYQVPVKEEDVDALRPPGDADEIPGH